VTRIRNDQQEGSTSETCWYEGSSIPSTEKVCERGLRLQPVSKYVYGYVSFCRTRNWHESMLMLLVIIVTFKISHIILSHNPGQTFFLQRGSNFSPWTFNLLILSQIWQQLPQCKIALLNPFEDYFCVLAKLAECHFGWAQFSFPNDTTAGIKPQHHFCLQPFFSIQSNILFHPLYSLSLNIGIAKRGFFFCVCVCVCVWGKPFVINSLLLYHSFTRYMLILSNRNATWSF